MYLRKTQQGIGQPFTLTLHALSCTIVSISLLGLSFLIAIRFFATDFHYPTFPAPPVSQGTQGTGTLWILVFISGTNTPATLLSTAGENFPLARETQLSSYQTNMLIEPSFLILNLKVKVKAIPCLWELSGGSLRAEAPPHLLGFLLRSSASGQQGLVVSCNQRSGENDTFMGFPQSLLPILCPEFTSFILCQNLLIQKKMWHIYTMETKLSYL